MRTNKILRILAAALAIVLCSSIFACCGKKTEAKTGVEDGVLTIAMECAYAPYNWTQADDSNGAVPIKDTNEYVNGYDIMIAKKICAANNWELEVIRLDWDSLVPAVQTGKVDAVIAGQSMTEDRMQQVDFAGPYISRLSFAWPSRTVSMQMLQALQSLQAVSVPLSWAPSGITLACPR